MRNAKGLNREQQERGTVAPSPEAWPQRRRDSGAASSAGDASGGAGAAHTMPPQGFAPQGRAGTCYCFSAEQEAHG